PKTALEGRFAFERWRARALVVAGAHRCASSEASGCPGRTKVCGGGPRAFPRSDAGHAQDSQFQAAHEALAGLFSDLVVVSLHGMAEDGISLSDGSSGPVEANSLLGRAARALAAAFPGERVTACQAGAGVPLAERLCGRTNLQGRLVNGARPPCGPIPITTRGRFLHIEQSMAVRAGPARLVEALTDALPGRQEEPRPAPAE
ncbi:MAG: hypothetical protein RBU30_13535, partial [Polyangia bacterium]|nr:hypothetical protein [Polyangia bacterium]